MYGRKPFITEQFLQCQIFEYGQRQLYQQSFQLTEINDMEMVKYLINFPYKYLSQTLNIYKIDAFLYNNFREIKSNYESYCLAFKFYTRFLEVTMYRESLKMQDKDYLAIHTNFFQRIINEKGYLTPNFASSYIDYYVQAIRLIRPQSINWFVIYITKIDQLDTISFVSSILCFLRLPDCDFSEYSYHITKFIQVNFASFLSKYDGSNTTKSNAMKYLIAEIISCVKQQNNNFVNQVLSKLLFRNSFWEIVVSIMKRCGFLCYFRDWVNMIIQCGNFICASHIVQYGALNFFNQVQSLKILEIMEDNFDWADFWSKEIVNKNIQIFQTLLESKDLYFFVLTSRILMHNQFESEQKFFNILNVIRYHEVLEKFIQNDDARISATELFSVFLPSGEDYLNTIYMNLKVK